MSFQGAESSKEQELVHQCLAGESDALSKFRTRYLQPLVHQLAKRGVPERSAREVIDTLWGDCVVRNETRPAILEKFRSRSNLRAWLFRIALNRVFDRARHAQRISYLSTEIGMSSAQNDPLVLADSPVPVHVCEPELAELLRTSLQAGFAACPAEDLLKLRLFYLHGLTKRELARLWGCHQTTISRDMRASLQLIADHTLQAVYERDPWLTLSWRDFVGLCEGASEDFH